MESGLTITLQHRDRMPSLREKHVSTMAEFKEAVLDYTV